MEKAKTRATRKWRARTDQLRTLSSQRFKDSHEPEIRSPTPTLKRGNTVSTGQRRDSVERRNTVSGVVEKDGVGIQDPTDRKSDYEAAKGVMKATGSIGSWPGSTMRWEGNAHMHHRPLMSPSIPPLQAKQSRSSSEVKDSPEKRIDSGHDDDFQKPRLTNVPNDGDNRQGRIEQMERYAEGSDPPKSHPKDRDSDHDRLPQFPESDHDTGKTTDHQNQAVSDMVRKPDETKTSTETSGSSFSNERNSLDSQPRTSGSGPTLVDTSPIHDLVKEQVNPEINKIKEAPDSSHSLGTDQINTSDPHPVSPESDQTKSPYPQPDSPESDQPKNPHLQPNSRMSDQNKSPDPQPNSPMSNQTKTDQQPNPPMSDQTKSADPQPNPPMSDQTKSPDPRPQPPEPGGATVATSPTQDQVKEDLDPKAWLKSDLPLQGNYKAIFPRKAPSGHLNSPRSTSPDGWSTSSGGSDCLVVPPATTDERENAEAEEDPSTSTTNADILKLFDKYEASSQLKPSSEEQEAKNERRAKAATARQNESFQVRTFVSSPTSSIHSDGSFIMSPAKDDDENHDILQDDLEKAKEEKDSQAALKLFELYSANFEMQKDHEEKEAKFKRDIQIAWKAPRPPPTTREQREDRLALERMESKEIFDEFGEQQRPVRTDPQLVLLETKVDIMITRARINYLLEDYPRMYMHANHAAFTASQLRFAPLTARCYYYRGIASYQYRDFMSAKSDFLDSRDCAGLYGIPSESIDEYIDLIDKAGNPEKAIIERFPARQAKRTTRTRSIDVENENEPSPTSTDDVTTLSGDSPYSAKNLASELSPFGFPLDGEPQPGTDDVPNYQPREQALSEQIRKDILESKAQSLNPASEGSPAEASSQERTKVAPSSMASTELTLLGSATSQGTMRRVPRPNVAPITTSFPKGPVKKTSAEAALVPGSTDV